MSSEFGSFVRRVKYPIEDVFCFTVLAVLAPPFMGGEIIKDQLQKSDVEKPGWGGFIFGVLLVVFTVAMIACCLLAAFGVISWEIGLGLLGGYVLMGAYAVWIN